MNEWLWEPVFWGCAALVLYTYAGYYLVLSLLSRFVRFRPALVDGYAPTVSVIVAARNEEANIAARIDNLLGQDYPRDRLEIIIGSDGSSDGTVGAASAYAGENVKVIDFKVNRGRAMTHNDCVSAATGEVLVFTDAETVFEKDFLGKVARYYSDPRVGAVTGGLTFLAREEGEGAAESFYFRYEKVLRRLESGLGLLASGSGACFSIRRGLYRDLRPNEDVDIALPLACAVSGLKVVIEPEARAYDYPSANISGVFRSRIRMTSQFQSGFWKVYGLPFIFSHPLVAWALLSRKAMRQYVGFFMLGALMANLALMGAGSVYAAALALQILFYGVAAASWIYGTLSGNAPRGKLSWPLMLVTAHIGMAVGVLVGLLGGAPSSYDPKKA